jgi:hypothetical protein
VDGVAGAGVANSAEAGFGVEEVDPTFKEDEYDPDDADDVNGWSGAAVDGAVDEDVMVVGS